MTLKEVFNETKKGLEVLFTTKPMEDILFKDSQPKSDGPRKPQNPGPWCF